MANDDEFDFENGFSDDEDINFGMDDQEEAKEASKRLFGKGVVEEGGEDDSLWNDPNTRVCYEI